MYIYRVNLDIHMYICKWEGNTVSRKKYTVSIRGVFKLNKRSDSQMRNAGVHEGR